MTITLFPSSNSFAVNAFWNVNVYAYVLLKENSSMEAVLAKSDQFYEKYMKSLGDQINANFRPMATPLAAIHLTSELKNDETTTHHRRSRPLHPPCQVLRPVWLRGYRPAHLVHHR